MGMDTADSLVLVIARRHASLDWGSGVLRAGGWLDCCRRPLLDPCPLRQPAHDPSRRLTIARARGERQIVDAVTAARAKNVSWQRIGELLGTSAQAAQQRYGAVIETA